VTPIDRTLIKADLTEHNRYLTEEDQQTLDLWLAEEIGLREGAMVGVSDKLWDYFESMGFVGRFGVEEDEWLSKTLMEVFG